jgi:site-specific DNA recombinase
MKKVATFSRVSTLDQHTSIENQEKVFKQWFDKNKGFILYNAYIDEGISGAKGYKRVAWNNMIADGVKMKFDILICKSFSRFGRNQRETLDAINKLRIKGIRIIFFEDGLDSEKDMANFGLMAWLAEKEANSTSERLKLVWDSFNIQGKIHTAKPIYGYDYNKENKKFLVNEKEAIIVRKIFNLYLEGFGYNKICQKLIKKNIPTKCGGIWQGNTIAKMLANEFYIGTLVQGKTRTIDATLKEVIKIDSKDWYRHIDNHEKVVSLEVFTKVSKIINERKNKAKESYMEGRYSTRNSNKSLFSNLLICGQCGSRMYSKRKKRENYKQYYNCLEYERVGTKCGHSSNRYNESDLIEIIKLEIEDLSINNYKKLENIKYIKNSAKIKYRKKLKTLNKNLDNQVNSANSILVNYTNGLLKPELYKLQSEKINEFIKVLLEEKEFLNKKIIDEENKEETKIIFKGIEKVIDKSIGDWTNAMLKEVIEEIVLGLDGDVKIKVKYMN